MKLLSFEDFQEKCNTKRCMRNTMYNAKKCITENKQKDCYLKYKRQEEKKLAKFSNNKVVYEPDEDRILYSKQPTTSEYYSKENFILDKYKFIEDCKDGKCNRGTLTSQKCLYEIKQNDCYKIYSKYKLKKLNEILDAIEGKDNPEWRELRERVIERDNNECQIQKILNLDEKLIILKQYSDEFNMYKNILDCCHIVPRSESKELSMDETNIVLCSRYFHHFLDQYIHPITREKITKEERLLWFKSAKKGERKSIDCRSRIYPQHFMKKGEF